jgi:hypothetical protein
MCLIYAILQVIITSALIEDKLLLIGSYKKTKVNFWKNYTSTKIYLHATNILVTNRKFDCFTKLIRRNFEDEKPFELNTVAKPEKIKELRKQITAQMAPSWLYKKKSYIHIEHLIVVMYISYATLVLFWDVLASYELLTNPSKCLWYSDVE